MALEENVLDDRQEQYLDWLCTAPSLREPPSKAKYATTNSVNESTMRRWEKLPTFRKLWEDRVGELQGSPERTQALLDSLYEKALAGDVKSAQLWMQATNRLAPPTVKVEQSHSIAELTDAELAELIAASASTAARQRAAA